MTLSDLSWNVASRRSTGSTESQTIKAVKLRTALISALAGDDRRVEVRNADRDVVAREWDEVVLGGRGGPSGFHICPTSVTLLREFVSGA